MAQGRSRSVLVAVLAAALLPLGSGAALGATITGWSDQAIARSADSSSDGWGTNAQAVADTLAGQVTQARYNLVWDFARLSTSDYRYVDFTNWLAAVNRRGLRPLVSFSADGTNPTTADYQSAVQAFRTSYPQISEFTAWNEPNNANTYASASQAAGYLQALTSVCAGACTIAAGDFAGTRTPGTYFTDYTSALNGLGVHPAIWAYHPYEVVNNSTSDRFNGIQAFWSAVGASSSSISVWFTEVGAFKCIHGTDYGTASQNAAAQRLDSLLSDPVYGKASRVYYYHLANGSDCDWDTGLLDNTVAGGGPRPALTTLFPVFAVPAVTTGGASGVLDVQAGVAGTVNPHGLPTTYHFDYGPTTSYGSSTSAVSAGAGTSAVAASATLAGLSPTTTYHYRLVATNALGTTVGGDQQFTTQNQVHVAFVDAPDGSTVSAMALSGTLAWQQTPLFSHQVAAGTRPSVVVWNGTPWVFFVDATDSNTISGWSWNASTGWQLTPFYGPQVAAGSSPSAVVNNGTLHVAFPDAGRNDTITDWVWSGSSLTATPFYGAPVAAGSSPSAVVNNGTLHVFFVDAARSNTISDWIWSPSSLSATSFYGPQVAAGSSPSAVVNNGTLHVVFPDAGRGNTITDWVWSPSSITATPFYGPPVAAGSSPSAVVNNGTLHVVFADASRSNTISDWIWSPSSLSVTSFYGDAVAARTSPAALVANGNLYATFADASSGGSISSWVWTPSSLQQAVSRADAAVSGTSPAAGAW